MRKIIGAGISYEGICDYDHHLFCCLSSFNDREWNRGTYKKGTAQTKAFLSGNQEAKPEDMHVKASNLYWGFTTSVKSLYTVLRSMHTGNTSDYIL